MNKWSRNSIYGAGLASLLYLGCGTSVQNKDIKVQEDIDLGLADRNLDNLYPSLNDLSRDDYSIDLGSDHVNEDTSLDDYVSSDLDYCSSLEINSPEWCEECNTPPVLENAYLRDPKPSYAIGEDIYVCIEASDPDGDELICRYTNDGGHYENDCTECGKAVFFVEGPGAILLFVCDDCAIICAQKTIDVYIED